MKKEIEELKKYCDKEAGFINDNDGSHDKGFRYAMIDISKKLQELLERPNAFAHAIPVSEPDYIGKLAHDNYPYGSRANIGSRDRSIYEQKKESFITGYNKAQE